MWEKLREENVDGKNNDNVSNVIIMFAIIAWLNMMKIAD